MRPPPALSERDVALEASIRLKLDNDEPLTAEEKAFLARLPGDDDVWYVEDDAS